MTAAQAARAEAPSAASRQHPEVHRTTTALHRAVTTAVLHRHHQDRQATAQVVEADTAEAVQAVAEATAVAAEAAHQEEEDKGITIKTDIS